MRVLVTGAGGFVGPHLLRELADAGHVPLASDLSLREAAPPAAAAFPCDVRDAEAVRRLVETAAAEACVHMAGLTYVPQGATNPDLMLSVNIMGTVNVLEAFRARAPRARVLVISTAQVYGPPRADRPIREEDPIAPVSIYGISKAAADLTTLAYASQHGMHALTARPNNHTGPGQGPRFAIPAFARQVQAIAGGRSEPRLRVGNLESRRNFMDVRDVVRAYRLLLERGRPGHAYNISSPRIETMGALLNRLCELARVQPRIEVDPALYRPADSSPNLDAGKIAADTGWKPEIAFDQTLRDLLAEW